MLNVAQLLHSIIIIFQRNLKQIDAFVASLQESKNSVAVEIGLQTLAFATIHE
jgi:hypothetical protein